MFVCGGSVVPGASGVVVACRVSVVRDVSGVVVRSGVRVVSVDVAVIVFALLVFPLPLVSVL